MIAFFKRRWVLLSCAVVLLAFSMADCKFTKLFPNFFTNVIRSQAIGLECGMLVFIDEPYDLAEIGELTMHNRWEASGGIHSPMIGALPLYRPGGSGVVSIMIPLWLPLSAVLGWIVFRELRWREKRTKAEGKP